MALPESTRRRLTQGVEQHTAAAAKSLLIEQDPAAAKAHLEWTRTAGQLLAASAPPARLAPLYRAGLIGLGCMTLLLLAWTLPVGNNALRLQLRVEGVTLSLVDGWELERGGAIAASRAKVPDGLAKLYLPSLGTQQETPRGFELTGQGLRLAALAISKGATLDLETSADGMQLFLSKGRAEGRLTLGSGQLDWFSPDRQSQGSARLQSPPGLVESVEFASAPLLGTGAPFALYLDGAHPWRFTGLRVSDLRLRRERVPGSNQWRSTLLEGKGQLLDVGRDFELGEGEWLRLQGLDAVLELARDGAAIKLLLVGKVDRLKAGADGLERRLTPSVLEYLSQSQASALLWGGLLFLWGLAWKLRALW